MNQGSIFVTVLARTRVLSRFANGGGEVFPNSKKCLRMRRYWLGRVAQLVRAPASHAGGHRFESCRAHHCFQPLAGHENDLLTIKQAVNFEPLSAFRVFSTGYLGFSYHSEARGFTNVSKPYQIWARRPTPVRQLGRTS